MQVGSDFWAPRNCLISPFAELDVAVDRISDAADAFLAGDMDCARAKLHQANIPLLRELAVRAMGAHDRELHRLRGVAKPPKSGKPGMRMPGQAVTNTIFQRDGWRCRFCGVRVVVPAARRVLARAMPDALCWQGPNDVLHAAFLYVSATLDHVVPHSWGGTNEPENLIAACWPCNFGRGGYLLEEMGINDPRGRPAVRDGWDGLTRLVRQSPPIMASSRTASPKPKPSPGSARQAKISAVEWLSQVYGFDGEVPDEGLAFLASCHGLPVSWSAGDVLLLKMTIGNRTLDVLGFERSGAVQIPWWIGDAKAAFRGFAESVAAVVPGAAAYETPKTWTVRHTEKRPVDVQELLLAAKVLRNALARLASDLLMM